jgi:hypothetical protein
MDVDVPNHTVTPDPPYFYRLLADKRDIRILVLHPASDHQATIECTLEHHSRPDAEAHSPQLLNYTALSYVW